MVMSGEFKFSVIIHALVYKLRSRRTMKISPQLIIDIYVNTQWGEIISKGGFIFFWKGVSDLEILADSSESSSHYFVMQIMSISDADRI